MFFKLTEEADSANQSNVSSPVIISKNRRSPLEFDDLEDIGILLFPVVIFKISSSIRNDKLKM